MFNKNNNKNNFHMPVPVPLLVFFWKIWEPEKWFGWSAEFYRLSYDKVTDIYIKWPTESGLVSQGIAIESKGSLFIPHQTLCQA